MPSRRPPLLIKAPFQIHLIFSYVYWQPHVKHSHLASLFLAHSLNLPDCRLYLASLSHDLVMIPHPPIRSQVWIMSLSTLQWPSRHHGDRTSCSFTYSESIKWRLNRTYKYHQVIDYRRNRPASTGGRNVTLISFFYAPGRFILSLLLTDP